MAQLPDPTPTLSAEGRAILADIVARRKVKDLARLGPYLALLNHPELAARIEHLGYYYKFQSTMSRDIYQFIVLASAKRSGVEFEWLDHIDPARQSGLPEPVIEALGKGAANFPEPYETIKRCMDSAFAYHSIRDDLQKQVIALVGIHGLIEIVTLCGFYTMFGMINSCFDVPMPQHESH